MTTEGPIYEKSRRFSIRIVRLYKYLLSQRKEFVISKQLLRSGTSIGANIAEGQFAVSKKEFLIKFQIALKECHETEYWLELLHETEYLTDRQFQSIYRDCRELKYILTAITNTTKKNVDAERNLKNSRSLDRNCTKTKNEF